MLEGRGYKNNKSAFHKSYILLTDSAVAHFQNLLYRPLSPRRPLISLALGGTCTVTSNPPRLLDAIKPTSARSRPKDNRYRRCPRKCTAKEAMIINVGLNEMYGKHAQSNRLQRRVQTSHGSPFQPPEWRYSISMNQKDQFNPLLDANFIICILLERAERKIFYLRKHLRWIFA